jgi:hypothetical protein
MSTCRKSLWGAGFHDFALEEHLAPGYCRVFSENDQNSVLMEIDKESDRSVVLVSASFLDDLLKSK